MRGIPNGAKDLVSEPQYKKVVHDFFSKVVIHAKDLIFPPIGIQGSLQFSRTLEVVAEGFLDLENSVNGFVLDIRTIYLIPRQEEVILTMILLTPLSE